MKQLTIMAGLLIAPSLIAGIIGGDVDWAGRLGLALVFAFTAIGHFIKTDTMAEMLPPAVPQRRAVIWISGFFEAALAASVLVWPRSFVVGFTIIGFLVAVFPPTFMQPFGASTLVATRPVRAIFSFARRFSFS